MEDKVADTFIKIYTLLPRLSIVLKKRSAVKKEWPDNIEGQRKEMTLCSSLSLPSPTPNAFLKKIK